jgi:signal transduction histidine kinase
MGMSPALEVDAVTRGTADMAQVANGVGSRKWLATVFAAILATAFGGWWLGQRAEPGSLLPHGYCFTWNPALLWSHVLSDASIGMAYVSIPVTLLHLVRKRTDMPFNWIVVLFAVFIVSCGLTHVVEVWTVWQPDYWLSASVKIVTAVASVLTAIALVRLVPRLLAIPTLAQLTEAKHALEAEVASRRLAEEALRQERSELARRVMERTDELARATTVAEASHAAAEEANRMKDRFLAKVSHELRTPLQSTLSWAQVLKQSTTDAARTTQAADRIMHNVSAQARLIDDLLDISTILSGKLSLRPERINAGAVIRKAADIVRAAAAHRQITIDVVGDEVKAVMDTDPVRLEQVLWNLVNNAVQASPDGGKIAVRFHTANTWLFIDVQDWGRGIDAADLPHIFEPFRQGSGGGQSHRGLGLGLAITRSIIDVIGGELHAHSDGPGRGATFSLKLPMSTVSTGDVGDEAEAPLSASESAQLVGLRVLYVEDEVDIAESGRLILTNLGLDVTVCLSYHEAARRITGDTFDLLLSDLNLGGGHTALDLLSLLHGQPHGKDVPALVLSAYGSAEDRKTSERAGFVGHIVKPAGALQIARAMLEALAAYGHI